jgi:hypothetical protein
MAKFAQVGETTDESNLMRMCYWPLADFHVAFDVAFGSKADMGFLRRSAFAVAIGCKADMTCCGANVRF